MARSTRSPTIDAVSPSRMITIETMYTPTAPLPCGRVCIDVRSLLYLLDRDAPVLLSELAEGRTSARRQGAPPRPVAEAHRRSTRPQGGYPRTRRRRDRFSNFPTTIPIPPDTTGVRLPNLPARRVRTPSGNTDDDSVPPRRGGPGPVRIRPPGARHVSRRTVR